MKWPLVIVFLMMGLWPCRCIALDISGRNIQLRVMVTSVPVHAGPGGSYRHVGTVGKGQVFSALDRSSDGAWYLIRLTRGTSGWVLAELVWPFEIIDSNPITDAQGWLYKNILAPSLLKDGAISLYLGGGVLGSNGTFMTRFGYLPSRHWSIELMAAQSMSRLGGVLVYGAELIIPVAPWQTLVPFAAVGAGGATTLPNTQAELFGWNTRPLISAGGGLLLSLRGGLIFRLDARELFAMSSDDVWDELSMTCGLMLLF